MGNSSEAMQRLVEDIVSSAENRHVKISEVTSNSRNQIERFRLEHHDMAKALSEKLSSDNTANKEATKQFMNSVRTDFQNMAKALNEKLSSENHNLLERFRLERHDMAKALSEKLSSDNTANKEATQQYMDELASDRGAAQRIWREGFGGVIKKPVQPVAEVAVEEPVQSVAEVAVEEPVQPIAEKETEPFPEKQILEVIAGHPEGIKLVDIGNELGVDWRGLISNIKPLIDDGKIDKIESLYYPKS